MKHFKKKYTVLVTGGGGFIGSNLVERLLKEGQKVRVLDNLITGSKENIKEFFKNSNFQFIKGDVRNLKTVQMATQGVDYIFHQAALPNVARSFENPQLSFETNTIGTLNVLLAAKRYQIKKVVYASSSSIYGPGPVPKKEDMKPNPISPYALSKWSGEKLCQIFSQTYGLPTICLRYFNVFGPRQNPHSEYAAVIPKFITTFLKGKNLVVFGDGKQTRDFTFVENVVQANLKAALSKFQDGEIFNIAYGKQASLLELIRILEQIFKKKTKFIFEPPRPGDIRYSFADVKKAKKELKYTPAIPLKKGLELTIDWYQKNL